MKKKMKRILAVVVTFVMLLGSLPVYAAGGDAERTGNDESASFWLQEYDLNSGLETDKAWYPDESGLIEVPLLDRTTKNNSPLQSYTEYGIALKDVNGLDAYNLYLDFNGIRENSDYDYSTTNYGTFGISADLKAALDSALSQQGSAEFKIEYKGATYTVRLLNEHDQGEQPEEPDQTEAVQHVIELINAIGEVTKESDDAINAAREAYDSLTSEEQGQVSNYDVLEAAEEAYKALLGGVVEIYDENGLREIAADGNQRLRRNPGRERPCNQRTANFRGRFLLFHGERRRDTEPGTGRYGKSSRLQPGRRTGGAGKRLNDHHRLLYECGGNGGFHGACGRNRR